MRNLLFLLFIVLVGVSCNKKNEVIPPDVLSEQQMVALLQEIYLKESKISKLSLPFDSSKVLYQRVESDIFQRHDVSDSLYESSMNWYYDHPDKLLKVYEIIVDSLMVLEKRHQENVSPERPATEEEL